MEEHVFIDAKHCPEYKAALVWEDAPQDLDPGLQDLSHCSLFTQARNIINPSDNNPSPP